MRDRARSTLVTVFAAGAMLIGALAFAQPPRGDGGRRLHMKDRSDHRLVEFLELTEDQQEAWRAAHQAHREAISSEIEQVRENRDALEEAIEAEDALRVGELTLEGRRLREQMRESGEALREQLEGILDAGQRERWEAFQAAREHGPRFGRRDHRNRRGPRGDA